MQVCEVIEWKALVILKDCDNMDAQMKLELLGALYNSNRPIVAICTDLKNFLIYMASGKEIQYYHTFGTPDDAGHISFTNAMRLIAHFLTEVSSKKGVVDYNDLASVPKDLLLGQLSVPLLTAKKLLGADEGLAEQLELVRDLPPEDQLEAAAELIRAWRHQQWDPQ